MFMVVMLVGLAGLVWILLGPSSRSRPVAAASSTLSSRTLIFYTSGCVELLQTPGVARRFWFNGTSWVECPRERGGKVEVGTP